MRYDSIDAMKTYKISLIVAALTVTSALSIAPAHASPLVPGPTNCGGDGQAPCLPGIPGPAQCALTALQHLMPCNWYGVSVAPGTPGSF